MYLRPEDKVLILEANARYNHAFDVQDVVEWLETWTDYAMLVTPDSKIEGKEAMRAWFAEQSHEGLRHFAYNICSEGDTETANATCDFLVLEIRDVPRIVSTGSYSDHLTRIGDRWKFASRKLTFDPTWKGLLTPA